MSQTAHLVQESLKVFHMADLIPESLNVWIGMASAESGQLVIEVGCKEI